MLLALEHRQPKVEGIHPSLEKPTIRAVMSLAAFDSNRLARPSLSFRESGTTNARQTSPKANHKNNGLNLGNALRNNNIRNPS